MNRPTGVTILGWLAIAWGAFSILVGVLGVFAGLYATTVASVALNSGLAAGSSGFALGTEVVALSFLGAMVGLGEIVFGVGALRLSAWGWTLGHVVAIASIVLAAASALINRGAAIDSVPGILIAAGVLYYLHTPRVYAAFKQSRPGVPPHGVTPNAPGEPPLGPPA